MNRARAVRFLTQYEKLATTGMDRARGYYWLGRSYRRGPKAIDAFTKAIEVEPLHWYAVLAAQRLRGLKVEPPAPFEDASSFSTPVRASGTLSVVAMELEIPLRNQ